MMKRMLYVRDCSVNWFEHVSGSLDDETACFYAKNPGWFATDLEGVIDWCTAERIGGIAVEGLLRDRHDAVPVKDGSGGFKAARRVCDYAKAKGIDIWLVTPRRADGLVYRELYDQPEKFDLLSPERVRAELPGLVGIAYADEPIDGGVFLNVQTTGLDFLVEPIRAACAAASVRGETKLILKVAPSPHRANAEFNYHAFAYFTDDPARTFADYVRDVMAPRLGGMAYAKKYVEWAGLVRNPSRIPSAQSELAQMLPGLTDTAALGRWYSLAEYLGAAQFAAEQREGAKA